MNFFQSDLCLLCYGEIIPVVGWQTLFGKEEKQYVCTACSEQLAKIEQEACKLCDRPFELLDPQYQIDDLCYDCVRWEEDSEWSGSLDKNYSIFSYNDFLRGAIARYKFRGDYAIGKAFAGEINLKLGKIDYDLLVPIPLSAERLYDRGFNQAEALIREAGKSLAKILARTHTEKQSKKSRSERIHLPQVFKFTSDTVTGKKIVLIDDIYTTGSTLRHAARILKEAGASEVYSLTLARG